MAAAAALRNVGRAALRRRGTLAQAEHTRLFGSSRPSTPDEKKDAAMRLIQIESKKEELFGMMAGFEMRYRMRNSLGDTNGLLLEQLSMAVEPKPHDPHWRWLRGVQRFPGAIYIWDFDFGWSALVDHRSQAKEDGPGHVERNRAMKK